MAKNTKAYDDYGHNVKEEPYEYDAYGHPIGGGATAGTGVEAEASGEATIVPYADYGSDSDGGSPSEGDEVVETEAEPTEEVVEEEQAPWTPEDPDAGKPSCGLSTKVPALKVDDAPVYEKSAQQIAWEKMHGGTIQDIIEKEGYGIKEETQQLMRKQQFDILKSREKENLRLLKQNLERRGITESGIWFSEEQKIKATTTRALAASMTEIQIKSAFIKMASFERALGLSAQFLAYLSRESELAYQPKLYTWQAEQQAKLARFQAQMEIRKIQLMQCYARKNMILQGQINSGLQAQLIAGNKEIAQMEIDAAMERAKYEAGMNFIGIVLGGVSALF